MNKNLLVALIGCVLLLVGGGYWWYMQPHTAEEQFTHAKEFQQEKWDELAVWEVQDPERYNATKNNVYDEIINEYQKVQTKYPNSDLKDDAEFAIADFYHHYLQDVDSARVSYERLIAKYPQSDHHDDALLKLAQIKAFESNDESLKLKAIDDLKTLLEQFPESELADDATFEIGKIYDSIDEHEQAMTWYQKLIDEYPDSELVDDAQYALAGVYEKQEEIEKAAKEYDQMIQEHGDSELAEDAKQKRDDLSREIIDEATHGTHPSYHGGGGGPIPFDFMHQLEKSEVLLNERILAQKLDVIDYQMTVELIPDEHQIKAETIVQVVNRGDEKEEIALKLCQGLTVRSIKLKTRSDSWNILDFEHEYDVVTAKFTELWAKGDTLTLHYVYDGVENDSPSWSGDHIDPKGSYLRFESKWYPQTHWGDLFTTKIDFTVSDPYTGVSIGELISDQRRDGKHHTVWQMEKPVFAAVLTAGNYRTKQTMFKGIPVTVYLFEEDQAKLNKYLQDTKQILTFYINQFGDFPFDKFDVVEIPFFPGGYGPPSMVMITEASVKEGDDAIPLLAHEIAHQWWGNLVSITLTDDSIPWLNEGFATYSDALYAEHLGGREALVERLAELTEAYHKSVQFYEDEPIATCKWGNLAYQPIVYYKGARVLDMLRYVMGDEHFFGAMASFTYQYAFRNAGIGDFQVVCEKAHGKALDWFFEQWLYRPGVMTVEMDSVNVTSIDGEYQVELIVRQDEPIFKMPIDIEAADITKQFWLHDRKQDIKFSMSKKPEDINLDPNEWLLKVNSESGR